jgi:hypothetical protein
MRHAAARRIIARLLQGMGFGEQAISQALMAALQDRDDCPDALKQLLEQSDEAGTDSASPYHGTLNQAPIPTDERELCLQLAPAIAEHPANVGLSLASLAALVQLWPHIASEERPLLRVRFLNGLTSRGAEAESQATREQLRAWQRLLPTALDLAAPSVVSLQGLLLETTPEGAYRCLAEHLDPHVDLSTLARVLGTLAVAVERQFHDREAMALHVLLGTTALERLAPLMDAEVTALLMAQLSHQLWWCRQRSHLVPIRNCIDPTSRPFREAVASGDISLAQRAARTLSQDPQAFWQETWILLADSISRQDEELPRALGVVSAIAYRSGKGMVSPDDAAALAACFAGIAHQRDRVLLP